MGPIFANILLEALGRNFIYPNLTLFREPYFTFILRNHAVITTVNPIGITSMKPAQVGGFGFSTTNTP